MEEAADKVKAELWRIGRNSQGGFWRGLASSLCVEARLLTQIFDTSSQLRLEECSTSCQLIALWARDCGRLGKSDVVVLHLKVASTIRGCKACGVIITYFSPWICLPGAVRT